jgi:8-oxo-dGTP pyrophosphatase MutT (NUDIX family)
VLIDALQRRVFRSLAFARGIYFRVLDPPRHGTLVAVWCRGRILITKSSYDDYYSLPGGYARRGEDARQAATRELREEVGIVTDPARLRLHDAISQSYQGRRSAMSFFELELDAEPAVRIDRREIVVAEFLTPEQALRCRLFPAVSRLLTERLAAPG